MALCVQVSRLFDILPTAKAGGFWDVNGICLLNAGLTLPLPIELMPQL